MPGEIYLWGSGGGACEIRHLIDDLNRSGADYRIKGLIGLGSRSEYEDLWDLDHIDMARDGWESMIDSRSLAVVTVGKPELREKMWAEIERLGLACPVLVHPSAVVAVTAQLLPGCVLGPNVTISFSARLEKNVYVSFNASVGHHSSIGPHGVISPGARIGGEVTCGPHFFIGLSGVIVPRIKIGSRVSVSAGALVASDLGDNSRVIEQKSRVLGSL